MWATYKNILYKNIEADSRYENLYQAQNNVQSHLTIC